MSIGCFSLKSSESGRYLSSPQKETLSSIITTRHIQLKTIWIAIEKLDYRLSIMSGNDTLKSYPVVFGPNPVDDKEQEGDGRTPEGEFKVRNFYPHQSWSKFIWIDYPNTASIQKFNLLKMQGKLPSHATPGGEIGIHGVPGERDDWIEKRTNWTAGCISLKNADVNEIYNYVFIGMRVHIEK